MLSYRHDFHAGNFADVFKHATLTLLIEHMKNKDTPFCYLETHAGSGIYDLTESAPQKNREFDNGICKLLDANINADLLSKYLGTIRSFNSATNRDVNACVRFYPGSPYIVRHLIRENDAMILCERHPADATRLKSNFTQDKLVSVHERDGYAALKALLPPKQKRGLVLIDPAYELKDEFDNIRDALKTALQRFAHGIYAIWYPLMAFREESEIARVLRTLPVKKTLRAEIFVRSPQQTSGMIGTGMVIINPPWRFDQTIQQMLSALVPVLSTDGDFRVDWLVSE